MPGGIYLMGFFRIRIAGAFLNFRFIAHNKMRCVLVLSVSGLCFKVIENEDKNPARVIK